MGHEGVSSLCASSSEHVRSIAAERVREVPKRSKRNNGHCSNTGEKQREGRRNAVAGQRKG